MRVGSVASTSLNIVMWIVYLQAVTVRLSTRISPQETCSSLPGRFGDVHLIEAGVPAKGQACIRHHIINQNSLDLYIFILSMKMTQMKPSSC